ncbi:MAG: methyltransferase family protein [Acidimicrobiia bacterium]
METTVVRRWRWKNFPVPESHLLPMAAATVLKFLVPKPIGKRGATRLTGWALVIAGIMLAVGATRAAGAVALELPDRLITSGAYARSRHPMYVAWTLIYCGVALVTGNLWLVILFPAMAGLTHREVIREEQALHSAFGAEHDEYLSRVRRYF